MRRDPVADSRAVHGVNNRVLACHASEVSALKAFSGSDDASKLCSFPRRLLHPDSGDGPILNPCTQVWPFVGQKGRVRSRRLVRWRRRAMLDKVLVDGAEKGSER